MTTLAEIETAVGALTPEQKYELYRFLEGQLQDVSGRTPRRKSGSVLDIAPVHLGPVLRPLTSDDDMLDEMLEGRT